MPRLLAGLTDTEVEDPLVGAGSDLIQQQDEWRQNTERVLHDEHHPRKDVVDQQKVVP